MNPNNLDKYLYIRKTPTWLVRGFYLIGFICWFLVLYGFWGSITTDPFFTWFVGPILVIFTIYHLISWGFNLQYKQFNLDKHKNNHSVYWSQYKEPSVDIFLPIAGESLDVLDNTWKYVSKLNYSNKKVYVLDDSRDECEEHKKMAEDYGFTYIERPNKGEMKKAGNLKYAYERTDGEFIAIFDADFAPHPDFLYELLPYTADSKVGIVQSPQYFDTSKESYKKSPLAYAAAYQEEFFYRIIQVAKDRVNGAICCGSNAIYRRVALDTIGGPRQVDASEDSRTGFAMLTKGFITRYIPLILAVGICPDNVYAYYHQQHRWCRGRSELVLSHEFRTSKVPFIIKLCNTSGFLAFSLRPLEVLLSFQLFWTLFFYNDLITVGSASVFYPYMIFSFILLPLAHIIRFRKEVFFASFIQLYATTHSIVSVFMGKSVGWVPTNAKHSTVSPAFLQTMFTVSTYLFIYMILMAIALRIGALHLFNYNYYTVQFWLFWNIFFAGILLWNMYKTAEQAQINKVSKEAVEGSARLWQLKTAGLYILLITTTFLAIVYL